MDKSHLLELSVIIVNYNVKYFLEQCLCSVKKACKKIDAEVVVIDNNSTDGSREHLENKFPEVNFIWNDSNIGFAKANNSVLTAAKGKYILFLNPDTILPEDCIEKCLSFFPTQHSCGALGVKMIDGSGRFLRESKRSYPTASASFFKLCGLSKIFPSSKIFSKYYAGHLPEDKINPVEVLSGAFIMTTRNALKKVKGFDTDFFMYGEDIDLCYRIQKEGFALFYFPETTIIHFKGESTQKKSKQYNQHFYGAMKLFVKKHFSKSKSSALILAIHLSVMMVRIKNIFQRTTNPLRSTYKNKSANTLVIGGQESFNEIDSIIKSSNTAFSIAERIDAHSEIQSEFIEKIETTIKEKRIERIIFCENGFSYKNIILLMELLNNKTEFYIHSSNSNSIIGSNDKNSNGVFITRLLASQ